MTESQDLSYSGKIHKQSEAICVKGQSKLTFWEEVLQRLQQGDVYSLQHFAQEEDA